MKIVKKDAPLISVIVPVYNAEKTLRECVDSILNQEYGDIELILVDDGSKDSSPVICDEYAAKDERVKVFHKLNGGVSSARNLGLDNAHGEWVTFVDSDDYITENYIPTDEIKSNTDLLIREFIWIKGDDRSIDRRIESYNYLETASDVRDFLNKYLTTMFFRGNVAKFYKKNLVGSIRFNENMIVAEDANFVQKYLFNCNSFLILHGSYYCVRLSTETPAVKYGMLVSNAIESLEALYNSFECVRLKWNLNRSLFYSYIIYFKLITTADWQDDKSKWYGNPKIKALYKYVWSSLTLKQKLRLVAARILRR